MMITFTSPIYLRSSLLYFTSVVIILIDFAKYRISIISDSNFLTNNLTASYFIIIIWSLFYTIFEKQKIEEINIVIEELNKLKSESKDLFLKGFYEKLIKHYSIYENIKSTSNAFFSRTIEDLGSFRNSTNIIFSFILIYISRMHFISENNAIGLTHNLIIIFLIIIISRIIYWEVKHNETRRIKTFIGSILLFIMMFSTLKFSLINNFGNEEIGTWFEKPSYNAFYNAEITNEINGSIYNYNSIASLNVFYDETEIFQEEDNYGVNHWKFDNNRVVIIDSIKISSNNWIRFNNCKVTLDEIENCHCKDFLGKNWNITIKDKTEF